MAMELVKENIECEQLLGENTADTIVKVEYIIPDTLPDVSEILMLDAKPTILSKEVLQDKIGVEGQVVYNIMYLARVEGKSEVFNAVYTGKFSNNVEIRGTQHDMSCEVECYVEHIGCSIVNERKIAIEGIIKIKSGVYKNYEFEIVKDVTGVSDIQMHKNPASVDKIMGTASGDMVAKAHIQIPTEKPQIGSIMNSDIIIHKKDIKILEGKVKVEASAQIGLLYKSRESGDIAYITCDVPVEKELDMVSAQPDMDSIVDISVGATDEDLKEDDLGESRIVDIEALVKSNVKVMSKQEIEVLDDAYSPSMMIKIDKKDYELNVLHGHRPIETIIKGDIELSKDMPQAVEAVMCSGSVCVTDKKLVEDKALVEGVLNVNILYKTNNSEKPYYTAGDEIPFSTAIEIPGCKIDMQCMAKANLEGIDAYVEAGNLAVKALVEVEAQVSYVTHKEFMVNMEEDESEVPEKKASVTIYVIQQGDTLWKIAKYYHTTIDMLIDINKIENPDMIKPGDKLIIPGRAVI